MPEIVVGPLLRYVNESEATVWVETDEACEVEVLGNSEATFCVGGHHYAIVCIQDLEPGSRTEYQVALDGEQRWPPPDADHPPSVIRTLSPETDIRISFGSCRVALPPHPPYTLTKDEHELGAEYDALRVFALELEREPDKRWPNLLMLLGDQVYVDEGSPEVREFIRSRRDTSQAPGEEVTDFEEYTRLYRESWTEPKVRWLLSTIPTAMVIDDHDMCDDWMISQAWLDAIEKTDWWNERALSGFMTYWLYQHLGNLSPRELAENETLAAVREAREDAEPVMLDYARRAYGDREGVRWSFHRDLGGVRVVVIDSRAGRVLEPGNRAIIDEHEREWLFEQVKGDFDHLVLATSDPFLLTRTFHHLEAWNERVCDGAWGPIMAKAGERMRQAVDFDHWGAFARSFDDMTELLQRTGAGEFGEPPGSIVVISGDVHHAYLAEMAFRRDANVRSAVYQAVCSPFRNPLDEKERRVVRLGASRPVEAVARMLARAAGASDPNVRWRFCEGPYFDNQIATLHTDGRSAEVTLEKTTGDQEQRTLETSFTRPIA